MSFNFLDARIGLILIIIVGLVSIVIRLLQWFRSGLLVALALPQGCLVCMAFVLLLHHLLLLITRQGVDHRLLLWGEELLLVLLVRLRLGSKWLLLILDLFELIA